MQAAEFRDKKRFIKRINDMRYFVDRTETINPPIDSKEWEKAETGYLNSAYMGEGLYSSPKTYFKLLRCPEGISVIMHTDEKNLRAEEGENKDVCYDSCMEFFYKPSPWDTRYLNFEINPKGVMHLGLGSTRFERIMITERKAFDIVSIANEGDWSVKFYVPDSFIKTWFTDLDSLSSGNKSQISKANFYKCGEKTDHPHYASWSKIETNIIDFHIPDFFGELFFK